MPILEIPFGKVGWDRIKKKVINFPKSERGMALKNALEDYVAEYLTKTYGEDIAGRLWYEEALDWQLIDVTNAVISALKQGRVPKVLRFEVERKPLQYREGVNNMIGNPCLRESLRLVRRRLALQEQGKKKKKWIQPMVKEMERKGTKGAFRDWCIKQGFTKVTKGCIQLAKRKARETGDTTLLRRAVAAENMLKASGVIEKNTKKGIKMGYKKIGEEYERVEVLPVGTWEEFLDECDVSHWEWSTIPYDYAIMEVQTTGGTYYIVEADLRDEEDFKVITMDSWDWKFDESPEEVFPKLDGGTWKDIKAVVWWPLPWGITDRDKGFFGYVILGPEEEERSDYTPLNGRIFADEEEALKYLQEELKQSGERVKKVSRLFWRWR